MYWQSVNMFQLFWFTVLVAFVLLSFLYLVAALAIMLTFPLMLVLTMLGMLFFMLLSTVRQNAGIYWSPKIALDTLHES